jgi:tRNA(Arg) A34 adenosine deaminase TadA
MTPEEGFMRQALELALENVKLRRGRPFGAVLVRDSAVLATGVNETILSGDPTAHAELQAIREASRKQGLLRFEGCTMYASGHPCPMCLGAMYMTGVSRVFYAYSNEVAESYGLSTAKIYAELKKPIEAQSLPIRCLALRLPGEDLYEAWRSLTDEVTVR